MLLPVSFYGGYFGAGVGVLLLGVFTLATGGDYRSANVTKNFVTSLNSMTAAAIFVVQGAMVGMVGTLGGLLLGLAIACNIDVIVPAIERLLHTTFLPQDIYLISRMPSDPQASDIVPIVLISLKLAFVATLYPSWRASRVNPAEALRYE